MKFSIIIPVKEINDYIRENVPRILELQNQDFEIIILPDEKRQGNFPKTKIIETGKISPALKRNIGAKEAEGEILAFLDDDAFPKKDWLDKALVHFEDFNIVAVGGPAVTPEQDSFGQKVSGAVFLSKFSGANPERYWPIRKTRRIDDWPSVNLFVRKSDFLAVGGFKADYWPGEDTVLCLHLIKELKKEIVYDPEVIVEHHRRAGLSGHLKQVGGYGIHRGFLAKRCPENSFKIKYFIPSFFFLFVVFGWVLLLLGPVFGFIYQIIWLLYVGALMISLWDIYDKIGNLKISLAAVPYIFLTHFYYGWRFIRGFVFTKNLKSKLRK